MPAVAAARQSYAIRVVRRGARTVGSVRAVFGVRDKLAVVGLGLDRLAVRYRRIFALAGNAEMLIAAVVDEFPIIALLRTEATTTIVRLPELCRCAAARTQARNQQKNRKRSARKKTNGAGRFDRKAIRHGRTSRQMECKKLLLSNIDGPEFPLVIWSCLIWSLCTFHFRSKNFAAGFAQTFSGAIRRRWSNTL